MGSTAALVSNPEKLATDDLVFLASVSYDVRALNDGTTHEPFGSPSGPGLWHHKGKQLPAYIQQIAQALVRDGTEESRAIATAVSRCKVWCAGGGGVTGPTKAKACAAVAEWEADKAGTKAAAHHVPELVTMPGVDLLAAGTWDLSSGRNTFTRQDIADAIEASKCPAVGVPVIKLGHVDPRFDGEPAIGQVTNLRTDDSGNKLVGDLTNMPGWLGSIAHAAFPSRSVEGSYGFRCSIGHDHPFVLTGLALLGITSPGVGVLSKLPDIAALYGVQAAASVEGEWQFTVESDEGEAALAVTEEDVRRAYYANGGAPADWWISELQMSPTQLVVAGGDGKIYRVPFQIEGDGGAISFGTAEPVADYASLAASRGTGQSVTYASAADSRAVEAADNAGWVQRDGKWVFDPDGGPDDDDSSAATDTDHDYWAADGTQLKAIPPNPATGKGGKPMPAKASAADAPTMNGDNETGDMNNAGMSHDPFTGTHSHAHAANGAQGDDGTHTHSHSHSGDADHGHQHKAATAKDGGSAVEFTSEQEGSLREMLGLDAGADLNPETVLTAAKGLKEKAEAKVAAGRGRAQPGVVQIEQEVFDNMKRDIEAASKFRERVERGERDEIIDAAIREGKFSAARRTHWQRAWDGDPDGTREQLSNLAKNLVPTRDIGAAGGSLDDEYEAEFAGLYPPGTFKQGR